MSKEQNPIDLMVGIRIQKKRKEMDLSKEQFADRLDVTTKRVEDYESGSCHIKADRLYAIAKILDVKIIYFFSTLVSGTVDAAAEAGNIPALGDDDEARLLRIFSQVEAPIMREKIFELFNRLKSSGA